MQTKPLINCIEEDKVSLFNIEKCVDKVKQEILRNSSIFIDDEEIFKIIDKWLSVNKIEKY